jgi:hypothetical protein
MIFDGFSKIYTYKKENKNDLKYPKIFNFYMPEEGMISISILSENNWHYHRDLRAEHHPASLIIAQYDNNNNEVTQNGLINYHMYILVDTEKIQLEKNKFLFLCKFFDPISNEIGTGGSQLTKGALNMSEKIRKKISNNKLELKKGEFWIRIEDVKKLFLRSDLCHMIFDGSSKIYKYQNENENYIYPKIFNFYMPEEGLISISILSEKNWHYHRELRDEQNPTSLILAQYDNDNNEIKDILLTKYQSNDDTEISKYLNKGYYLVWAYTYNNSKNNLINIRFCSDVKIGIKYMGDDINFE